MQIKRIQIKNFRCFDAFNVEIEKPVVLLTGPNGSGKTSLLEALHYACYLKSFRTHTPRDLIHLAENHFFIKIAVEHDSLADSHEIQIGYAGKKKLIKLNQKSIQSFKELTDFYRIVTLTEDDLTIIKGGPEVRRSFLDQALILMEPESITLLRKLRVIVDNRNALLQQHHFNKVSYDVWTEQLWHNSQEVRLKRSEILATLERRTNALLSTFASGLEVQFQYDTKSVKVKLEDFLIENPHLCEDERRLKRSLFGAHLDDIMITLCNRKTRTYGSRGQQKLITVLLKIAHMQELITIKGSAIFLLDDFLTDFDEPTVHKLLSILSNLGGQLIFTCPTQDNVLENSSYLKDAQRIKLTHRIFP